MAAAAETYDLISLPAEYYHHPVSRRPVHELKALPKEKLLARYLHEAQRDPHQTPIPRAAQKAVLLVPVAAMMQVVGHAVVWGIQRPLPRQWHGAQHRGQNSVQGRCAAKCAGHSYLAEERAP